jgi:5-methylcytosine-specific restriction enzyme A
LGEGGVVAAEVRIYPKQFVLATMGLKNEEVGMFMRLASFAAEHGPRIPRETVRFIAPSYKQRRRCLEALEAAGLLTVEDYAVDLTLQRENTMWMFFGRAEKREPIVAVSQPWRSKWQGREPIPEDMRAQVIERDQMVCGICKRLVEDRTQLHIDHIFPVSRGGKNELDNLQVAHAVCNMRKGAKVAG